MTRTPLSNRGRPIPTAGAGLPLFCYGTLRHPLIIGRLLGRSLQPRPAILPGHALRSVRRAPYPATIPDPDAVCEGVLYQGPFSADEFRILDCYEGTLYERVRLQVRVDGKEATAWVYRLAPGHRHWASRRPWSYRNFLRTGLHRYLRQL